MLSQLASAANENIKLGKCAVLSLCSCCTRIKNALPALLSKVGSRLANHSDNCGKVALKSAKYHPVPILQMLKCHMTVNNKPWSFPMIHALKSQWTLPCFNPEATIGARQGKLCLRILKSQMRTHAPLKNGFQLTFRF